MAQTRRLKMSPAWLSHLSPGGRPIEFRDTEQRGLVLRMEASGRKTWVVRYTFNGAARRYTIGAFPAVTLAAARTQARRKTGMASNGTDPQAAKEQRRAGECVKKAVETWRADPKHGPASRWKGGLDGGSARCFLPHMTRFADQYGRKKLAELTTKDIERFVTAPVAAATRNRALTALRGFFKWCVRKGLIDKDPSVTLAKDPEHERTRVLTDRELRVLIDGFAPTRYGRAVRLLALTGLRRDEVLGAKWIWFDAAAMTLTIPPADEKNGRTRGEPRRVALSAAAVQIFADQRKAQFAEGVRSDYIFATTTGEKPDRGALKRTIYVLRGRRANGQAPTQDKRSKPYPALLPKDATIHDIRRTVADALLNRVGASPWVVDHVVLGHQRPKLLRTYMPVLPIDEARTALTAWSELLAQALADQAVAQ